MNQPDNKPPDTPEDATASRPGDELRRLDPSAARTFQDGEVIAGRFRIVRFLGRGGMGEVYEAEDLELRERLALKTIRPEIARIPATMERFKQEIQLSRRVTHVNVCRVFDVFHHRGDGPDGDVTFLTMELLQGETLAERIRREGKMTTAQALPLVGQMATALAAAHQAGIIHRDFKSANVMLVPKAPGERAVRAVVTDFGLAHSADAGEGTGVTVTAGVAGTPEYMAPEQLEGRRATAAADVYALGLVIYEMITGARPFTGDTPLAAALKRLRDPAPSPRDLIPDLDPRWERMILRCLERDPALRFAGAEDLLAALGGEELPAAAPRKRRLKLALAGAVLLSLLAAFIGYQMRVARKAANADLVSRPVKLRRSVAVLGFRNLSGHSDAAWLSTALSEMLGTELGAGGNLRTISGEDVARMKIELSLGDADSFAKPTLARIRKNLGADFVVLGSYIALGKESGGQIRLDLRIQNAIEGETTASVAQTGTETKLFDLVSQAGLLVRKELGAGELTAVDASGVRAALPSSPEATRYYSEGLARLRVFDAMGARGLLEKAVAADPRYALAHAALAEAWSRLGYDRQASEAAKRAFELSATLPREERFLVEGRYRETTREWDKTIEVYRTLRSFFPDNLDYGLRLAAAQTSGGKGKDALATVEALRKLPPPASDDPRIDLAEATAAWELSDYRRQHAAAAKAIAKGSAQGARLLVASALMNEANAFRGLGEPNKATEAWEEARRTYEAAGDRGNVATVVNNLALLRYSQGDLAVAKKMWEESLAIHRAIGKQRSAATALNNIAGVLLVQGDLAGAKKRYEEALAICRKVGDRRRVASVLNNLGEVLTATDLGGARKKFEEALAISREVGDQSGVADTLTRLGTLFRARADLAVAKTIYEEVLGICRKIGNKSLLASGLFGMGEILAAEGNLAGAQKSHEEALALRNELGEKRNAADSRLALASLAIENGRAVEAEAPAREAAEVFQAAQARESQVRACVVLARSLAGQGKPDLAQSEIERAIGLAAKGVDIALRLQATTAAARIQAVLGNAAAATKSLSATIAEAKTAGHVSLGFDARLALGEIEMTSGRSAAGRARLKALERAAKAKGLGLIARKAARLRAPAASR
jgi:tetratricopeptide (TPR) repeat protein/tRNA A-37 threonylcarbamoyl transferase component Bud32